MFPRLGFSQTVVTKLVDDQGIVSSLSLASLSDEIIATIGNVIRWPVSLVSRNMPYMRNQISFLVAKNLKLAAFMFKLMKLCSKPYNIRCINITSILQYQHQWELEQKKTNVTKVPIVD